MTLRESVLISTVTVMPGERGTRAPSMVMAVSSSATVTGKDEALRLAGGGRGLLGGVGGGGGVGHGALGLLLGDRAPGAILTTLPCSTPKRVNGKASTLTTAGCPSLTKPMSRLGTSAST